MGTVMWIISIFIQIIALTLFCIVSGYVFSLGRNRSGMNLDYLFFCIVCLIVFLVL